MNGTNDNFVLYLHISPSSKKYFGITSQKPEKRWQNGHGYRRNQYFWRAIQKYGWDNIDHVILADNLTKDEACLFEQIFIALYDTTNHNNGYNNSSGGEHGLHSEESKRKMSESHKGEKNPMYGKGELLKGENSYLYGKFGKNHHRSKSVICLTTGIVYESAREAERMTGFAQTNISATCRGKLKSTGKTSDGTPLRWKYIKDLPKPKLTQEQKQHLREVTNIFKSA